MDWPDIVECEDGSTYTLHTMTVSDLRGIIKRIEMERIVHQGTEFPREYIPLVRELYMRTGGKAPGEQSKVAVYGDSKKPKSTWRKL